LLIHSAVFFDAPHDALCIYLIWYVNLQLILAALSALGRGNFCERTSAAAVPGIALLPVVPDDIRLLSTEAQVG